MPSIRRIVTNARDALREDGLPGLGWMLRCRWLARRCRGTVREMLANQAEDDRRWDEYVKAHPLAEETRLRQGRDRYPDLLSFLIPTYNTRPELLEALAESLLAQTCGQWEACFYDGASTDPRTVETLRGLARRDPRLRVELGDANDGISGNTNRAFQMSRGSVVALCDHDDLLDPEAVWHVLRAAAEGADLIYTDEDKCDETGERFFGPHLKPDFAPDSLRAGNYVCHLMAMRASLMREAGGLRPSCDGSQDHDLALRASEKARKIVHIPRVLYHWRQMDASYSHQGAERCAQAAARAVRDQLGRLGLSGEVSVFRRAVQLRFDPPPEAEATVTLMVTGGHDEGWLREVMRRAEWPVAEMIPAREGQRSGEALRASGRFLAFIQCGVMPPRGWLRELVSHAARPDVACAGAPLADRRQRYLHCGYAWDPETGAVPMYLSQSRVGPTYQLYDRQIRNVSGVSSALMCIRRDVYWQLGGFAVYESDLRGLALGLKALAAGYVNVIAPAALAIAPEDVCLTGPAPAQDLSRLRQELPGPALRERYLSPWLKSDGSMRVDFDKMEEAARV